MKKKDYRRSIIEFINYLHVNTDVFKNDIVILDEVDSLRSKQRDFKPKQRYGDIIKYNELQKQIDNLFDQMQAGDLIKAKAEELFLYDHEPIEIRNNLSYHIEDVQPEEVEILIDAKNKYTSFRKETKFCDFMKGFLFTDLDLGLMEFFGMFTDVSDMERPVIKKESPRPEPQQVERLEVDTKQFNSYLTERMTFIHEHLQNQKYIDCNADIWLYWFKLKELNQVPEKIKWLKADSTLSNVIQHITGKGSEDYIKRAFVFKDKYQKPTKKEYQTKKENQTKNLFSEIEEFRTHGLNLKRVK